MGYDKHLKQNTVCRNEIPNGVKWYMRPNLIRNQDIFDAFNIYIYNINEKIKEHKPKWKEKDERRSNVKHNSSCMCSFLTLLRSLYLVTPLRMTFMRFPFYFPVY